AAVGPRTRRVPKRAAAAQPSRITSHQRDMPDLRDGAGRRRGARRGRVPGGNVGGGRGGRRVLRTEDSVLGTFLSEDARAEVLAPLLVAGRDALGGGVGAAAAVGAVGAVAAAVGHLADDGAERLVVVRVVVVVRAHVAGLLGPLLLLVERLQDGALDDLAA